MKDALVGKFFHSLNRENKIIWQGEIIKKINDDYYLCQLFEWLNGTPSCKKVTAIADMKEWSIYDSASAMNDTYMRRGQQ